MRRSGYPSDLQLQRRAVRLSPEVSHQTMNLSMTDDRLTQGLAAGSIAERLRPVHKPVKFRTVKAN